MEKKIITLGHLINREKNAKCLKFSFWINLIKERNIKSIIDLRIHKEENYISTNPYAPFNLRVELIRHGISYISLKDKVREYYEKITLARNADAGFQRSIIREMLCMVILKQIDLLNEQDTPVGLLFPYWEAKKTVKGMFSSEMYKSYPDVEFDHLAPASSYKNWGLYPNKTLITYGNGYLIDLHYILEAIRKDFEEEEQERMRSIHEANSNDIDEMYRNAFDNDPDASWNID